MMLCVSCILITCTSFYRSRDLSEPAGRLLDYACSKCSKMDWKNFQWKMQLTIDIYMIGPGPADVAADVLHVCPVASGFGYADQLQKLMI